MPLSAVLDEREKRQAAERRLAEFEQRQREAQARQSQQQLPPEQRLEQQQRATAMNFSRKFAERAYGADTIAKVHAWAVERCDKDPFFNQQMMASDDPYEGAFQAWQREQVLEHVKPDDLADFQAWKAAKAAGGQAPAPASAAAPASAIPSPASPRPPVSLANQPNAGGGGPQVPVGPGAAHASLFAR